MIAYDAGLHTGSSRKTRVKRRARPQASIGHNRELHTVKHELKRVGASLARGANGAVELHAAALELGARPTSLIAAKLGERGVKPPLDAPLLVEHRLPVSHKIQRLCHLGFPFRLPSR